MTWAECHSYCSEISEGVESALSVAGNKDPLLSFLLLLGIVCIMDKVIMVLLLEFHSALVPNGGVIPVWG